MEKRHLVLIVPLILVTSCQQEMDVPDQFKAPDITAEIQTETRTVLSVDEYGAGTIYWKSADQIDVFIGDNKLVYTSQNSLNAATATFKTNDDLGGNYPDSEPVLAIYPSYEESHINEWGDRLVCSYLPSRQYGLPGTFDDDLFMAVATGTKQNMGSNTPLSFHNICSGLKFSLSRDDITCVKFGGTDSSNGAPVVLAGDVFFEFDGSWSGSSNGDTEITLYPKNGSTFQKDAYYYIICLPASLQDFYVEFETQSGQSATLQGSDYNRARYYEDRDKPFEFKQSVFLRKTHIDEYARFSDESVPHTQIRYWTTGKPSFWEKYSDGFSYIECFGVDAYDNQWSYDQDGGYGYINFYNPVSCINQPLFKDANLTNIYLPNSITILCDSAFEGCTALREFSSPGSLSSIGKRAFWGCSSLTSFSVPEGVMSIGDGAFAGCSSMMSFTGKFASSNGLYLIDSGRLIAVAGGAMSGDIAIPEEVTHLGDYAYYLCNQLTSITLLAHIPPVIGSSVFDETNNCPIYVPAGSLNAYKTAWSEYADRIKPNVEAVDLGLPSGVKWATCNVGASSPEEYGDYFAWGETTPKSNYDWSTYLWCNGSETVLTKYNIKSENGVADHKTVLDLDDDAAHVNWGGNWRMPTSTELQELESNCTWSLTTQGGKKGYRATSKLNGNSVFFPCAGGRVGSSLNYAGSFGLYWSSSLLLESMKDAYCLDLTSSEVEIHPGRTTGVSVRPVFGEFVPVQSVSLDQASITLTEGTSSTLTATVLPSNATEKTVTWSSSNESVVTVNTAGQVEAVSVGTATITAWASDGEHSAACTVTVTSPYHAVDMGLSVQWASCNVGASSPEDYGDYFAWGETQPKSGYYDWASYSLCNGTYKTLIKYNLMEDYGVVDNKSLLDQTDDAASVNWGDGWRIPTQSEMHELGQLCTWVWTTQGGKNGYRVTSNINGNSIFLPAAGVRNDITPYDLDAVGSYWSMTNDIQNTPYAYRMDFDSSGIGRSGFYRAYGMSIRPVYGVFIPVESVSLNHASLELQVGQTSTLSATVLPASASEKAVTWTSDNTDVATVTFYGLVTAVSYGSATITARTNDGLKVATCVVTVDHEWVDLGLPSGLKWATCNVGASSPEDYGDYFAWGEVEPKSNYSWSNYKWCNGSSTSLTKYNKKSANGIVDNKTVLEPDDDAAHFNWGGNWRMPTIDEFNELRSNCSISLTTQGGVSGYLFKSINNGNSVFFPNAGLFSDNSVSQEGSRFFVWRPDLYDSSSLGNYYSITPNPPPGVSYSYSGISRYIGMSIRPVKQ